MPATTFAESLHHHLFAQEGLKAYVILDGAVIPNLLDQLYGSQPEFECLYRGDLQPDLAEVAPYLVRLEADAEFTSWVLEKGWGNHWGIFAMSQADLPAVRRHFRTFLIVHDPDGKPLYFRYYDPRVLRIFLQTCDEEELGRVFGPVHSFLAEDESSTAALGFRKTPRGLQVNDLLIATMRKS